MLPIKSIILKINHLFTHKILHVDDTPRRLALGIGLGVFTAWTPTMGFHMFLAILIAKMIGANVAITMPVVWITNPLTFIPIYYGNYRVGEMFLSLFGDRPVANNELVLQKLTILKGGMEGLPDLGFIERVSHIIGQLGTKSYWHGIIDLFWAVGLDLWVGSILIGGLLGVISYFLSYHLIVWYRHHTPRGRLHMLHLLRRKKHKVREKSRIIKVKSTESES
jgi:uncharacterized protein (DUF2062 family)